jgi:type I restriction enzyme S subunit
MELVKEKYKETDVGLIPSDWDVKTLSDCCAKITDGTHDTPRQTRDGIPFLTAIHVKEESIDFDGCYYLPQHIHEIIYKRCNPARNDVLMVNIGAGVATTAIVDVDYEFSLKNVALLKPSNKMLVGLFLNYYQQYKKEQIVASISAGGAQPFLSLAQIGALKIGLPSVVEQTAIANALSDADALITSLEKLIAKKRNIKQGVMQKLLTPKEGWVVKKLGEIVEVLDNLRVPLNDSQRVKMKGDIPYCGANGIVDYVNDYVIDDDIILMAEDGGYFDEYKTRPIAYRMIGKCWVNNHAHIVKAIRDIDQGFLFYSLVHKNILDFINGGTRAKLNKGDLLTIEVSLPVEKIAQTKIAIILNDMDAELTSLEKKLEKAKMIKQGMMQQLLTGRIRLV